MTLWVTTYLVKDIGAVRGGEEDDPFCRSHAVHFNQELVQRVFLLCALCTHIAARSMNIVMQSQSVLHSSAMNMALQSTQPHH